MIRRQPIYRVPPATPAARPYARRVAPRPRSLRRARLDQRPAVLAGLLFLSIYLAMLLSAGGFYVYYSLSGRILPGVCLGPVRLGGLTVVQAAARLEQSWQSDAALTLTDGSRRWAAAAGAAGFGLDAAAAAERAYAAGRAESGWVNLAAWLDVENRSIAPAVSFDPEAARFLLEQLAPEIDIAPVEARVTYHGGRWEASAGRSGSAVDIPATAATWAGSPEAYLRSGLLPLVMRPLAPQVMDASRQAARLQALVDTPLRVRAYDPVTDETFDWQVPPETMSGWLRVEPSNGSDDPLIRLAEDGLADFLQQAQPQLGGSRYLELPQEPGDLTGLWQAGQPLLVRVRHEPTSYTVQSGENLVSVAFKTGMPYWMIQRANPGVSPNSLAAGQELAIPSLDDNLPLPVVPGKRIVISISSQRLWTYENGEQRSESVISTGIPRSPTMPGVFQVQTHDPNAYASNWDLWMPNFMGIYEAVPGFMNGIHGLPMLSSGQRLWANVLGTPASYGCIILTLQEAEDLYSWAEAGVVVEIRP